MEHDSHNQCAKHCSHRLQPGICGPKLFSPANKRNTNKQHKQQNNDGNVGPAVAFMSFDFGPYLSKRTGADLPDISGRALLVLCDGLGGLAVDDGAEQNLPLQLGQLMQSLVNFFAHIHERVFIRSLWQILRPVKPAHIIVDRVAHFLRQERFRIVRSGLFDIHIFQSIWRNALVKVGLAVVEHVLQLLPLLWMLLHPLVCGSGSFRVHGAYPAPIRLKLFIRLGILEGHELTTLSVFTKSLHFSTVRFCDFSLSNSRRTISPGWSFLRFGTARPPR